MGLVACSGIAHNAKEDAFTQLSPLPINEMNEEITLSLPIMDKGIFVPKLGDDIILELKNNSNKLIKFPSDYGLKMYTYTEEGGVWIEIKNMIEYYPIGNRQVSPKGGDYLGYILISAFPTLPVTSNPTDLRIVITGTIYQDGTPTNKQVGAYLDITIQP